MLTIKRWKPTLAKAFIGIFLLASIAWAADGFSTQQYLLRTSQLAGDALSVHAPIEQAGFNLGYNGSTWDRLRTASAADISATSGLGVLQVAPLGNWSVVHTPTTATQATASKSAGASGVRHVCTGIYAVITTVGTAQTLIQVNLRDGATGAGTILWSESIQLPTNGIFTVNTHGLSLFGTAATAMTLEFSAAGVTASAESVTLTGYDTQ